MDAGSETKDFITYDIASNNTIMFMPVFLAPQVLWSQQTGPRRILYKQAFIASLILSLKGDITSSLKVACCKHNPEK